MPAVRLAIGSKAPPFALPGVDDQTHSLADVLTRGRAAVVVFSCNHCPFVQAYEPRIIGLAEEVTGGGVGFLLINSNDPVPFPEDSFENMKQRSDRMGYPFPYLHDASQEVAEAYGAQRTPEVFLVDEKGALRYHGTVDDNVENADRVTRHYLRDAIRAVLEGGSPDPAETDPVGCAIKWRG